MPRKVSYLTGHKKCGIKVGDKVKVKRIAEDYESGWGNQWADDMDSAIGRIGKIEMDEEAQGFTLAFSNRGRPKINPSGFSFPYFVLEKIKK